MAKGKIKRKFGIVAVLDALGASKYSEQKIQEFLSARTEINSTLSVLASSLNEKGTSTMPPPRIFTFGDTLVITIELSDSDKVKAHLSLFGILMRRYLFHSLEKGILFRGSFSVGPYIEDAKANTVMGEALTDAASWYARSEWMGLSCTPRTNNLLEYHAIDKPWRDKFICKYDVPLKGGSTFALFCITWPAAFFDDGLLTPRKQTNPRKFFLEIFKGFNIPLGTEGKYENTKRFFSYVADKITDSLIKAAPTGAK